MAAPAAPVRAPLTGSALKVGTIALALATFMNVLDASIANVSIPAIAGDLGVSPSQGTWVITSFSVANAISVPLTGWLTQRVGAVKLFTASVLLFVIASWLCGLATSLEMLIGFRVLQGFVSGPMNPLSQTLLMSSYPPAKVGAALSIWAMTTLVAPVAGPLLGGWITDHITWPWIFYINVPVGLIAAFFTWTIYRKRETEIRKLPIDSVGLALLVVWVGALQIMVDKGKELDWFNSALILSLAVVAVVGFVLFVIWELTEAHPVVDLRLFKCRGFSVAVACQSVGYGLFFGIIVLQPLWLQQYMGYTATQAGMASAPMGLMAMLFSPLVGRKVGKWDPRAMASLSFVMFAVSMWMRSQFSTDTEFIGIVVPTLVQGVAVAFFFIPLTSLILAGQKPQDIPAAAGLSNFSRLMMASIMTSVATTTWDDRATLHHAHLVEQLGEGNSVMQATLAGLRSAGLSAEQALAMVNRLIDQQAFTRGVDDVFLVAAGIFAVMTFGLWLAKRPARAAAPPPEAAAAH